MFLLFYLFLSFLTRNIKENTWDLAKVLKLINLELRARETCTVPEKTEDGKNSAHFDSELSYRFILTFRFTYVMFSVR